MKVSKMVIWVGDSLNKLKTFPNEVQDSIGYSLQKAQEGLIPRNAKLLKGLKPTVVEIVSSYDTNTYRAVYTAKVGHVLYVLHCFQKKSKQGIKTPKQEIEVIKKRLRDAIEINRSRR